MKSRWRYIVLTISLAVFGVCALTLGQYFMQSFRERQRMTDFKEELAREAEGYLAAENEGEQNAPAEEQETADEKAMLMLKLSWAENADVAAWVTIPGTTIDYPLMYTPEEPDYYLNHDVTRGSAASGTPYLDARCDLENTERLVAYGHNMKDGSMFADLLSYENKDYREEHSRIRLVLPEGIKEYEVAEAFRLDAGTGVDLITYEFDVQGSLLILCTCEYSYTDGRFVVVGREVKPE